MCTYINTRTGTASVIWCFFMKAFDHAVISDTLGYLIIKANEKLAGTVAAEIVYLVII